MKTVLLAAGAFVAVAFMAAAPAGAQDRRGDSGWNGSSHHHDRNVRTLSGRFERRGDRRSDRTAFVDWYGGDWAYANNRSWAPDSYNDWWHDEPWRAYPRWMMHNEGCARQWYAGDTLRC